jgi:spore germination protein YaaH
MYSTKQLFTVSGSGTQLAQMVASSKQAAAVSTLVSFAQQIGFSGVDIDFEGLSSSVYPGYLAFVQQLGTALHAQGLELEIDVTAYANAGDESLDAFRYEDAVSLPVDGIVVMAYDFMTDYAADGAKGAGDPIAPTDWTGQVIDWAFSKVGDKSRVVIGMPSYGYSGTTGSTTVARGPSTTLAAMAGASSATEFPNAFEETWGSAGTSTVFITASELDSHRAFVVSKGATAISVWSLGGNSWFTK